jgi:hypothetical protein
MLRFFGDFLAVFWRFSPRFSIPFFAKNTPKNCQKAGAS